MKYKVFVKTVMTEIFIVKASSKEEAMELVLDDDNNDEDYCKSIEIIEGDPEVYYPDIQQVRDDY